MTATDDDDCIGYARECVRLAGLTQDPELRDQLLNMARDWMATAMHERKVPTPRSLQTWAAWRPARARAK